VAGGRNAAVQACLRKGIYMRIVDQARAIWNVFDRRLVLCTVQA
jgi:hypothetical protein